MLYMFRFFITCYAGIILFFSVANADALIANKAEEIAQSSKVFVLNYAIDELYEKINRDMHTPYIKAIVIYDYDMKENLITSYKKDNRFIIQNHKLPKTFKLLPNISIDIVEQKDYDKNVLAKLTLYYDPSMLPRQQTPVLHFTKEEKAYLASHNNFKMCIDPDWLPFEAFDKQGKYIGISAEILKIAQEKSGISFEVIKTKDWAESLKFVQEGKCDILSLAMKTQQRSKYLDFTTPYIDFPFVVLTNHDKIFINNIKELYGKKVSIVKGYAYIEILKRDYPQVKIIEVDNIQQGIDYVRQNKVYGHVDALGPAAYTLQKEGITDVKIAGKLDQQWRLSVASTKKEPILKPIMQKIIQSVPAKKIQAIQNRWLAIKFEEKTDYALVYKILLIFGLISIIVFWRYRVMKKVNAIIVQQNEALNKLSKQNEILAMIDRLTNLYNRHKLDEVLMANKELADRYKNNFGLIFIDIDHFKNVNDTYGHNIGDEILKSLSSILLSSTRKTDTVGRWGGEEFLIIVPNADKESIMTFAENLRVKVENFQFASVGHLTISLGASIYKSQETCSDVMTRVDKALYMSKNDGRNCISFL